MQAIQPYFVTATNNYKKSVYRRDGIAHFYRYFQDCQEENQVIAVPDGCVDILFTRDGSSVTGLIAGTVLEKQHIGTQNGKEYFGVRFSPGVTPAGLQVSMGELVKQELPIEALLRPEWLERIEEASDEDDWIVAFLEGYHQNLRAQELKHAQGCKEVLVRYLKGRMEELGGNITIAQLAEETGYSVRYLHQCFQDQVGLPPKTYSSIIKFQRTIQTIHANTQINMTDLCVDMGYYDQAHFSKIFKKNAALSPKAYLDLLKKVGYHHRLQVEQVQV